MSQPKVEGRQMAPAAGRSHGARRIAIGALTIACALSWATAADLTSPLEQAEALLRAGQADEAAVEFERLLEVEPANERALLGRTSALLALDAWRQALEEARRRHDLLPGSKAAATGLAEALARAGRLEEAEDLLEGLVKQVEPRGRVSGRALSLLGMLRAASGQTDEAIALMSRAIEAAPDDRRVLFRASEATTSRAETTRRLERYLELAEGDDPDRIEGVRGTLRVLQQLGDREVWIPTSRPDSAAWPLEWLAEGGRRVGGILRVRLGEKGKKVRLLLDTGSSGLFLDDRVADRVGFEALAEETTFGGGGDERHRSRRVVIPAMRIGSLEYRDVLATTARNAFPATAPYRGVIGVAMLAGYRVTIDFDRGRLEVDQEERSAEGDRYWTLSGQMLVPASAGGTEGLFLFDTGATRSIVDEEFAKRSPDAKLSAPARVEGFGGELRGARLVSGLQLALQGRTTGREPLRAVDLSLRSRLTGVELSGYLGMDLLEGQRLTIDTRTRRILLGGRRR